ncbi:MAG: toprim domain-containing protein, partial [Bacilli bacterium]|nr:toprim domain-containing protein [Bacilli bacterium]
KVVGFTGRIYLDNNSPKYLNSKETYLFKKGNILFNYHRAKDAVRLAKKLIIVEGNMDAIRMYANGIKNTIALMGTSLTANQINEIKKLRVPIILMLDNDNAGNIATFQVGTLLEKEGLSVFVVRLSGKKDPDEYIITNGVEAMNENIKNAISFLEFKLSFYKQNKNLQDSEELANYIKEVLNSIKENNDLILKEITLKKLSDDYGLSLSMLKDELAKLKDHETPPLKIPEKKEKPAHKVKFIDGVNHILYFMMNDGKYILMYKSKLGFLNDVTYRGVASEIMAYYELHKTINIADFMTYAERSKLKKEIYEIIESIKDENMDEQIMEEYIMSVKKMMQEQEIKELKQKLKLELDSNKKMNIAMKIQALKKEV